MLPIIQSLWIGDDLTNLEKLCVQSFIDHGHEFHLYTYADIGGKLLRLPGFSKNANFPPDSVFEQLKRKHGIPSVTDAPTYAHDEISALFVRYRADGITRKEAKKSRLKKQAAALLVVLLLIGFALGVMV